MLRQYSLNLHIHSFFFRSLVCPLNRSGKGLTVFRVDPVDVHIPYCPHIFFSKSVGGFCLTMQRYIGGHGGKNRIKYSTKTLCISFIGTQ